MTDGRFDCGQCGQNVGAREYHPYTYCVLHRAGVSVEQARKDLAALPRERAETGLRVALERLPRYAIVGDGGLGQHPDGHWLYRDDVLAALAASQDGGKPALPADRQEDPHDLAGYDSRLADRQEDSDAG